MITTRLHGMYSKTIGVIHMKSRSIHSVWLATLCAEDTSDLSKAKLIKQI